MVVSLLHDEWLHSRDPELSGSQTSGVLVANSSARSIRARHSSQSRGEIITAIFYGLERERAMNARPKRLDERVQQWFLRVARKRPTLSALVEGSLKEGFLQERQESGEFPYTVLLLEESPNTEAVTIPPLHELNTYPSFPTVEKVEEQPLLTMGPSRKEMAGSGQFERGQCDIAIARPYVTLSSVVVVLLTGNPGPVVVQYVSLDPGRGFTVHLSAPVERRTPFNYVIL